MEPNMTEIAPGISTPGELLLAWLKRTATATFLLCNAAGAMGAPHDDDDDPGLRIEDPKVFVVVRRRRRGTSHERCVVVFAVRMEMSYINNVPKRYINHPRRLFPVDHLAKHYQTQVCLFPLIPLAHLLLTLLQPSRERCTLSQPSCFRLETVDDAPGDRPSRRISRLTVRYFFSFSPLYVTLRNYC